jgi:hypothetical protein
MIILTYPDASIKETAKEEIIICPSPNINVTTTPKLQRTKRSFKRESLHSPNLTLPRYYFFRCETY